MTKILEALLTDFFKDAFPIADVLLAVILCYILIMSAGVIVNVVTHYFKIGGTAV